MPVKQNQKNPLVIVTGPDKTFRFGWWATKFMLWLVNLRGHYVTANTECIPPDAKGVIIGGGDDIEPSAYGLIKDEETTYDPERDKMEMEMAKMALKSKVPVLGICRGAQLINVVLGGSLHQDIRGERKVTPNKNSLFPIKWAFLRNRSALKKLLTKSPVRINSLHKQAVNEVGEKLKVAAKDEDGFIQAIENDHLELDASSREYEGQFVVGVQWHPEYMPYAKSQRQLFKTFAKAVRGNDRVMSTS